MSNEKLDTNEAYQDIVCCARQCSGIRNNQADGIIPRSFLCISSPKNVELLIVSKNPANAPDWEIDIYRKHEPEQRAQAHMDVLRDLFWRTRVVNSSFHANLVRRVAGVLGVEPTPDAVFANAAFSALVKCESSGNRSNTLPSFTKATCFDQHFLKEVALFRPCYLLALGDEVYKHLTKPSVAERHGLPVGKLYHPSWSNMRGGEASYFATEIPRLRKEFQRARRGAQPTNAADQRTAGR